MSSCEHENMQYCLHGDIKSWEHVSMQTIVINSQKGGSGKTMLCKHLAVEAERAGDSPVFLIDTDPQGTLTAWHSKRESETPARVDLPFDGLEKGLSLSARTARPIASSTRHRGVSI